MGLSSRNRDTLRRVFEEPTRADIDWDEFVRLVEALGGSWQKPGHSAGSRRKARLSGVKGLFHQPHPGSVMRKGSVESAREFLRRAGFLPGSEGGQ